MTRRSPSWFFRSAARKLSDDVGRRPWRIAHVLAFERDSNERSKRGAIVPAFPEERHCRLRFTFVGAIASIEDEAYFQETRSTVMRNRADLAVALTRLGFEVLPSSANFVFARHPGHSGEALVAALRDRAVLVRHFAAPRIADFLRITIGSEAELRQSTEALSDFLD